MFFVLVYVLVCLFCSSLLYIYRYRLFVLFSHYHALLHFAKKKKVFPIPIISRVRGPKMFIYTNKYKNEYISLDMKDLKILLHSKMNGFIHTHIYLISYSTK